MVQALALNKVIQLNNNISWQKVNHSFHDKMQCRIENDNNNLLIERIHGQLLLLAAARAVKLCVRRQKWCNPLNKVNTFCSIKDVEWTALTPESKLVPLAPRPLTVSYGGPKNCICNSLDLSANYRNSGLVTSDVHRLFCVSACIPIGGRFWKLFLSRLAHKGECEPGDAHNYQIQASNPDTMGQRTSRIR